MQSHPCILFSGKASQNLEKLIVDDPQITLGKIHHHQFASGEWYCQLKENVRGADVFLLQAIVNPANDNLMQLLIMADAARRSSADRITAVVPYLGYARQDRKDKSRVPISAKLVLDIIAAAGIDRIVTMDLHAQQIQGFTNLPFDHLYFGPTLMKVLENKDIDVIVAPDTGAIKKAVEFSEKQKLDFAFIVKKRTNDTTVETTQFVGDVANKNVLILDDLTESGGTLLAASKECKANGAKQVYCAVTHGCLTELGYKRMNTAYEAGIINGFYCSNTVMDISENKNYQWMNVINVVDVFQKAIKGVHNNESITSLFAI